VNVLVDTPIWSLAFRRREAQSHASAQELAELIREGRAQLLGVIRQELLSGVKAARQFDELRLRLRAFPDVVVDTDDHEQAAAFFNHCRSRGIQGSAVDLLICAVAARRDFAIFTTDGDFPRYALVLPIRLHAART
jgi:predicted nucleic acid-binding protein